MKKNLIFLLTLVSLFTFGQETKKIIKEYKKALYKEIYYVLKTNNSIRQGNYQKIGNNNFILVNGYYKNGLKDSIWTEYNWYGKNKKAFGFYNNNEKNGVWEYYNFKGELEQKYNHTSNEIVYFRLDDKEKDKEFIVIKNSDSTKTKLERPPLYIGGSALMLNSIFESIQYPFQAIENEISGKVFISFIIDSLGTTSNFKIDKGIGYGCDEEALKVVKEIPSNWIPGRLNGHAVNVVYIFPINFTLKK